MAQLARIAKETSHKPQLGSELSAAGKVQCSALASSCSCLVEKFLDIEGRKILQNKISIPRVPSSTLRRCR